MRDLTVQSRLRRAIFLGAPAALAARLLQAQFKATVQDPTGPELDPDAKSADVRLPNGKKQQDEILKADYEKNVKDAQELATLAKSFEQDMEKGDRFVFSISSLKKLDDIEKLTRRIRGRIKRI